MFVSIPSSAMGMGYSAKACNSLNQGLYMYAGDARKQTRTSDVHQV